jgi:hypothetical protein
MAFAYCYKLLKIMRFVIFLGLTMIAKCIDSDRLSDAVDFVVPILIIALIVDIIDCYKRWTK